MSKTIIATALSDYTIGEKSHPNRILTVVLRKDDGTECSVVVRKPVGNPDWTEEEIQAVQNLAPKLYKSYKKYDLDQEIELLGYSDQVLDTVLSVNESESFRYEGETASYRAALRAKPRTVVEPVVSDRFATAARIEEIRKVLAARELEYRTAKYRSHFDFHLPSLVNEGVQFINILETDHGKTDYLDGLARADLLGEIGAKFVGVDSHGRRVLVIKGKNCNNVVLFERFTPEPGVPAKVVSNVGDLYRRFIMSGIMGEDAFLKAVDLIDNLKEYEASLYQSAE